MPLQSGAATLSRCPAFGLTNGVEKIMAMSAHRPIETNGVPLAVRPVVAREIARSSSAWRRRRAGSRRSSGRWAGSSWGRRASSTASCSACSRTDTSCSKACPGLAKTLALKTLAGCIHGARFGRIQFTPDMLPSDITGTTIYHGPTASFQVKHGPVFANLVLADEINRAPAKVQSALLEAMQERQVTLGDAVLPLPDPFLVLATQNPLEQEGTYPLPEAQIDRFMLKVVVRYPSVAEERAILDSMAVSRAAARRVPRGDARHDRPLAHRVVDEVYVDDAIRDYIVRIVIGDAGKPGRPGGPIAGLVRAGASPAATIALTLAARGWAFLQGRGYVVPEDVKALAPDVLRHRITLSFDAEAQGIDGDEIVRRILAHRGVAVTTSVSGPSLQAHRGKGAPHRDHHASPERRFLPGRCPVALPGPRNGLRRAPRVLARRRRPGDRLERVRAHGAHVRQEIPRGAPAHGRVRRGHERLRRSGRRRRDQARAGRRDRRGSLARGPAQ